MRKRFNLIVLILPLMPMTGDAIQATLRTRDGLEVNGMLAPSPRADRLSISTPQRFQQISVFFKEIQSLSLAEKESTNPNLLNRLEALLPTLPYWDPSAKETILAHIEERGNQKDWETVFIWANRIEPFLTNEALQRKGSLMKGWALFEMGLFEQADATLRPITQSISPLNAPLRLCRLKAALAEHFGQAAEARHWQAIPALQIPSKVPLHINP